MWTKESNLGTNGGYDESPSYAKKKKKKKKETHMNEHIN